MLASPTRRWSAGAVLLALLILAASWFLLISPRRDNAAELRDQVTSAQSQATSLQTQIAQLKTQFGELPKRKQELAAITSQLPATADMPALVRSLQDYAAASGVSLDALTPGTPAIYSADGTASTATTASAGSVITIPLTLTVSGDYFEDALFVKSLQTKLKRAFLITGLATESSDQAPVSDSTAATPAPAVVATPGAPAAATTLQSTSLQITGSVFVLLDDSATLKSVEDQSKAAAAQASPAGATAPATAAAS